MGKKFEVVMNTRGNQELDLSRKADMLNLKVHGVEDSTATRPIPWLMIPIDNPTYSERHKINYDTAPGSKAPFPTLLIYSKAGKMISSMTGGDYGLEDFHNDDMMRCLRDKFCAGTTYEDAKAACLALH